MKMKLIGLLGSLFMRTLHATLRLRHVHPQNIMSLPQCIIAFWHCHLLLMLHTRHQYPATVIISRSKDGDYITSVFGWYGVGAVRGSSTRGGSAALREMIRLGREGHTIVFTPDGPKGPARVVKEGIVAAAKVTGLPIVPIAFAAKKKSSCARGTGWSSPSRSHGQSSSTANRSSCRVTATWKNGAALSRSA